MANNKNKVDYSKILPVNDKVKAKAEAKVEAVLNNLLDGKKIDADKPYYPQVMIHAISEYLYFNYKIKKYKIKKYKVKKDEMYNVIKLINNPSLLINSINKYNLDNKQEVKELDPLEPLEVLCRAQYNDKYNKLTEEQKEMFGHITKYLISIDTDVIQYSYDAICEIDTDVTKYHYNAIYEINNPTMLLKFLNDLPANLNLGPLYALQKIQEDQYGDKYPADWHKEEEYEEDWHEESEPKQNSENVKCPAPKPKPTDNLTKLTVTKGSTEEPNKLAPKSNIAENVKKPDDTTSKVLLLKRRQLNAPCNVRGGVKRDNVVRYI